MKITEEEWLRATAHEMERPDTVRAFDNVPDSLDLFALFSYALYDRIKDQYITKWMFIEKLVEIVIAILPDRKPTKVEVCRMLALFSFGVSVYNECIAEKA